MKLNITCIIVLFCIGFAQSQTIDLNESGSEQTSEFNQQQRQSNPYFESAKRVRPFNLNSQITNHQNIGIGNQINLSLFEDIIHPATVVRKATDINGVVSLTLKLNDFNYSYAYIAISPDSYLVTVDIPEKNEKYSSRSGVNQPQAYMLQLDETEFQNLKCAVDDEDITPDQEEGREVNPQTPEGSTPSPGDPMNRSGLETLNTGCHTMPAITDPATISIMIVYTPAAETWANTNQGGILNTINTTMANLNNTSINNNLVINFQLSYSGLVNYTEQGTGTDWINLLTDGDGILDDVHNLRKTHNADLVAMLTVFSDGIGGIANLLDTKYGNNRAAFSVTKVNAATNSITFTHEIGHNMGAMHNASQLDDAGPTIWENWPENTWSAGWRWQGSDTNYYADLMSYPGSNQYGDGFSTTNIPYFSDPDHTHLGGAAGQLTLANNARTLNEIKHYVARYKETIDYCNAGNAPLFGTTSLYISNVTMGDINNTSGGSSARYGDFTALATCMLPGDTQTLDISVVNSASTRPVKVWIDWNDDTIFDPVNELVYDSGTGASQHSLNITAPLGVSIGDKRMRIRVYSTNSAHEPIIDTPCGYSGLGEVEDYTIRLESPPTCSVSAVPLNLIVSDLTGNNVGLSWSPQYGIEHYELRYREIGVPDWVTISLIWYPFYSITDLAYGAEYEVQLRSTCNGTLSDYTAPLIFEIPLNYCAAGATSTSFEKISNVTFNTINNNSTSSVGYEDFTNISTSVDQGVTYPFSASFTGTSYSSDQVLVWIDFNQNGDFTDPGEQVLVTPTSQSPWGGNITIPANALEGPTRMRVRLHDTSIGSNSSPCGNSTYGQVEDYTVIVNLVVCEATVPVNLQANNITQIEATLNWDVVPTATYNVRYRETGAAEWIELLGLVTNTVTLENLVFATEYEVQVSSVCDVTAGTYSPAVIFTTENYCASQGGSNWNITNVTFSDINHNSSGGNPSDSYTDFTNIIGIVNQNFTYSLNILSSGGTNVKSYRVWIDYNQNGIFEASELVLDEQTSAGTVSDFVTIPSEALLGNTRMRVSYTPNIMSQSPCASFSFGEVEDYTISIVAPDPCVTDAIVQNIQVSAINQTSVNLNWDSLIGVPQYDLRYRVIESPDWVEVTPIYTNSYNLTGLNNETAYEIQVRGVCDGLPSAYSSSIYFTTLKYCQSSGGTNINIVNVTFGDINQSSPGGSTVSTYTDYTAVFTTVERGQTYAISITSPGPPIGKNFRVWIDYNFNGSFEDSGELVLDVPNTQQETIVGNITPPEGATLGNTRMRVSVKMYSPPQGSCDIFGFGEVEDYTVEIKDSTLGQETVDFGNDFKIFPNPINEVFYILTQNIQGDDVDISVTNIAGQKVFNSTMKVPSNGSLNVEVPGLSSGMYLVNIIHPNGGKFTSKLIKQ